MTREQIIRELAAEGLVIVPAEPTAEMVEAGFRDGIRIGKKAVADIMAIWGPRAGAMHPHEPGLVSAIREAIRAGALKP